MTFPAEAGMAVKLDLCGNAWIALIVTHSQSVQPTVSTLEVFRTSLRLGLTSFGGPIAHLGYFERTYVQRLKWLSAADYASLVGLCQLLPGPSSSQVSFLIGLRRAGWPGGIAAWVGFTLPSALLMFAFGTMASQLTTLPVRIAVHGLMLAAVAVVAQAVWSMARSLCPDWRRAAIAIGAAALLLSHSSSVMQWVILLAGALAGAILCRNVQWLALTAPADAGVRPAWMFLALFVGLLVALSAGAAVDPHGPLALASICYRTGAVVFGGGHVVLPLLRDALVPNGWMPDTTFLTGYGFAQAMPGPLFAFSAYLGAVVAPLPASALWASAALLAIFLPGILLAICGTLIWNKVIRVRAAQAALAGVNAAVVGLLGAALYNPVWTSAVQNGGDVCFAVLGFVFLTRLRAPPILVVVFCVVASAATAVVA